MRIRGGIVCLVGALAGLVFVLAVSSVGSQVQGQPGPGFDLPTPGGPKQSPRTNPPAAPKTKKPAPQPDEESPDEPDDGMTKRPAKQPVAAPDTHGLSWDAIMQQSSRKTVSDKDIKAALARGLAFLKSTQALDGSFSGSYPMFMRGETAQVLLALQAAAVGQSDPAYEKGLKYLLEEPSDKTYVNSLMAQVYAGIPAEKRSAAVKNRMAETARFLTASQLDSGMWTYPMSDLKQDVRTSLDGGDNSNTWFAMLGLWKLWQNGTTVEPRILALCEKHFLDSQLGNGGWNYGGRPAEAPDSGLHQGPEIKLVPSVAVGVPLQGPSSTAAGLATLHILSDMLHMKDEGQLVAGKAAACGKALPIDERIDKAQSRAMHDLEAWLSDKPRPKAEGKGPPPPPQKGKRFLTVNDLYYLYAVERLGAASGRRFFGQIDWYATGARLLLDQQNPDGSWGFVQPLNTMGNTTSMGNRPIAETAFAMLFLARGNSPVFFNKLRYGGDWDNDRRDVVHLIDYAAHELEQSFNWQVIDIRSPVNSWVNAPVLYLSGHEGPNFSEADKKKIKDYIGRSGFILAEACCGQPKFSESIKALGKELWPDLQWQELPPDHPLFTHKSHLDLKKPPKLFGLTNAKGFTFFVLSSEDLSCVWGQNLFASHDDLFKLGINIYRYAQQGQPVRPRLGN